MHPTLAIPVRVGIPSALTLPRELPGGVWGAGSGQFTEQHLAEWSRGAVSLGAELLDLLWLLLGSRPPSCMKLRPCGQPASRPPQEARAPLPGPWRLRELFLSVRRAGLLGLLPAPVGPRQHLPQGLALAAGLSHPELPAQDPLISTLKSRSARNYCDRGQGVVLDYEGLKV